MRLIHLFILLSLKASTILLAQQSWQKVEPPIIYMGDITLSQAFTGGYNSIQIQEFDLENDNKELFCYDPTQKKGFLFSKTKDADYLRVLDVSFPLFLGKWVQRIRTPYGWGYLSDSEEGISLFYKKENNSLGWQKVDFKITSSELIQALHTPDLISVKIFADLKIELIYPNPNDRRALKLARTQLLWEKDPMISEWEILSPWQDIKLCACRYITLKDKNCQGDIAKNTQVLQRIDWNEDGIEDLSWSVEGCVYPFILIGKKNGEDWTFEEYIDEQPSSQPMESDLAAGIYKADIFGDATQEVLFSPFSTNAKEVDWSNSIWGYESGEKIFMGYNIFQQNTLDMGYGCRPFFWDFDEDGDDDLFLASKLSMNMHWAFVAKIGLLLNLSVPEYPAYKLETDDFAFLSELNLLDIRPKVFDYNKDGREGLLLLATNKDTEQQQLFAFEPPYGTEFMHDLNQEWFKELPINVDDWRDFVFLNDELEEGSIVWVVHTNGDFSVSEWKNNEWKEIRREKSFKYDKIHGIQIRNTANSKELWFSSEHQLFTSTLTSDLKNHLGLKPVFKTETKGEQWYSGTPLFPAFSKDCMVLGGIGGGVEIYKEVVHSAFELPSYVSIEKNGESAKLNYALAGLYTIKDLRGNKLYQGNQKPGDVTSLPLRSIYFLEFQGTEFTEVSIVITP